MKQNDVIKGCSYLFATTTVKHRMDMIGTVVMVTALRKGAKKAGYNHNIPVTNTGMMRIKLSNGRNANASELKKIP